MWFQSLIHFIAIKNKVGYSCIFQNTSCFGSISQTIFKFLVIIDVSLANTFERSTEMLSKIFRKMITLCRVPLQGHNHLILLVLRRTSNHSLNLSPIVGKRLNRRMAEAAHSSTLLVSRDTRCVSYIPAAAAPSCVPLVASGKAERKRGSPEAEKND